jgi:hypothetical protein
MVFPFSTQITTFFAYMPRMTRSEGLRMIYLSCYCEERDFSLTLRNRLRNLRPHLSLREAVGDEAIQVRFSGLGIATPRQVGARNDKKVKYVTLTLVS